MTAIQLHNLEQREAENINKVIKELCQKYGFLQAQVSFGDNQDNKLIFIITGKHPQHPEPVNILGIIDNK